MKEFCLTDTGFAILELAQKNYQMVALSQSNHYCKSRGIYD